MINVRLRRESGSFSSFRLYLVVSQSEAPCSSLSANLYVTHAYLLGLYQSVNIFVEASLRCTHAHVGAQAVCVCVQQDPSARTSLSVSGPLSEALCLTQSR